MEPDDTLITFGGAVKALDDSGRIGGHLVLFGSPTATDASRFRDYFTAQTDFGLDVASKSRILYAHGLDPTLKRRKLGVGSLKVDKAGVWLEGQLDLRDDYEKKIFGMVKDGKLGFSSGTAPHLVGREVQPNGSNKIVEWPLGLDASLTPTPAEPRTAAVALKSLTFEGIKGEHLGPDAAHSAAMNAIGAIHSRLTGAVYSALADDGATSSAKLRKVKAAHDEARDLAMTHAAACCPPSAKELDEDLRDESRFRDLSARFALAESA